MPAVSTMILASMRMTGEKERGDQLDANEQVECLAELNTMIESWSINRLNIYTITEDTHALTASTSTYTIGTNGTISTDRPVKIVDPCFVRDSGGYDTPVTVITKEMYDAFVDKDAGYTVPTYLYYDMGFSATSTGTIHLYPAPNGGNTLHINSWKTLQNFASLSTIVLLPPGYQAAIESNYAIRSATGYTPVSPELRKLAIETLAAIQSLNLPNPVMRLESATVYGSRGSGRSILTGP